MDEQTHKALLSSIEKWERNAEAETSGEFEVGAMFCPLCQLFLVPNRDCHGCPVMAATGRPSCQDTPYGAAEEAWDDWEFALLEGCTDTDSIRDQARAAARKEVEFLKSLLPEGETTECKFDAENTVNIRDLPNGSRCIDEGGKVFRVKGDAIQRRPYLGKTSVRICVDIATGREQRFIRGILVTPLPEGAGHD